MADWLISLLVNGPSEGLVYGQASIQALDCIIDNLATGRTIDNDARVALDRVPRHQQIVIEPGKADAIASHTIIDNLSIATAGQLQTSAKLAALKSNAHRAVDSHQACKLQAIEGHIMGVDGDGARDARGVGSDKANACIGGHPPRTQAHSR